MNTVNETEEDGSTGTYDQGLHYLTDLSTMTMRDAMLSMYHTPVHLRKLIRKGDKSLQDHEELELRNVDIAWLP